MKSESESCLQTFPRAGGILLPIFSLPSHYGIGTLGKESYRFIDFLKSAGQTYWQILPVGPTSYGDSPYQSFSAFASNPYFIDLDMLTVDKLLMPREIEKYYMDKSITNIDYGYLYETRFLLLQKAVNRFDATETKFCTFLNDNRDWIFDYALFMALKEKYSMKSFLTWDTDLKLRKVRELEAASIRLVDRIKFWEVLQYLFFIQWKQLKQYAHANGIQIIGDIPIYVALDSADLWAHPELFLVDNNIKPLSVSGCPPDSFAPDGQLWGNPLYDWKYHQKTKFSWWLKRLKHAKKIYDVVRIDHFRGFSSYYSIPFGNKTADGGSWIKAPGLELIEAVKENFSENFIIAEDLGYLTEDVKNLLHQSGFPGMKVLQFAFDSREESDYLPHNYPHNCVVYTGTHDNTTTSDWQLSAKHSDVAFAKRYLNVTSDKRFTESFIRSAVSSVADTAIIPLQDYLNYGKEARINTPGTIGKNWQWRVTKNIFSQQFADKIYDVTSLYGRLASQNRRK